MKKTHIVTEGALIAALYVVLTYISNLLGLANGMLQVRISEALTILPAFSFSAVPGITVGCLVGNLITGASLWDIIFGTLATLIGAVGTYYFGKNKFLAPLFPIAANTAVIPLVLKFVYGADGIYSFLLLSIFAGELISCGILGVMLYSALQKSAVFKKR